MPAVGLEPIQPMRKPGEIEISLVPEPYLFPAPWDATLVDSVHESILAKPGRLKADFHAGFGNRHQVEP